MEGEAEASKESNVGLAKARAIDAQVKAYGGAEFRVIQEITDKLSDAIKNAKVDIVPKTIVNMGANDGSANSSNSTVMDTLLKFITMEKLGVSFDSSTEKADAEASVPVKAETKSVQEA